MISVGEASGDLHGASIADALKELEPDIRIFGMGGQAMRKAGVEIVHDIADLGIIGFVEVVKNLPRFFRLRDELIDLMKKEQPDVLLVIDYPDFNMRLAPKTRELGIPVVSYIPPSAWAWRKGRAKSVAKIVDKIASIFPFEAEVYQKAGADVEFVGHPLIDIIKPSMDKEKAYKFFGINSNHPVILLLPGSRKHEIENLLPVMLKSAEKIKLIYPECQFILPVASTISQEMLQGMIKQYSVNVKLTFENTYDLMAIADSAIAASGTVTLEAAILGLPTVVIYKMAAMTYFIGRLLVKIPNISLPNIVAGKRIIPELLQYEVNADNIARETLALLPSSEQGEKVRKELLVVKEKLGAGGAVKRAAQVVLNAAKKR